MSICECPTCQEVKGAVSPVKDQCEACRKTFPACNGTITTMPRTGHLDCLSWAPRPAPAEPEKACSTCGLGGKCIFQSEFTMNDCINNASKHWRPKKNQDGKPGTYREISKDELDALKQGECGKSRVAANAYEYPWMLQKVGKMFRPEQIEKCSLGKKPLDHAALFAEHWDGYTGPMVDYVAEAVKKIAQLGGEEDETDRAIDAVVKALKFTALSHWVHGAKHEREGNI